jgi:hypothetical protein
MYKKKLKQKAHNDGLCTVTRNERKWFNTERWSNPFLKDDLRDAVLVPAIVVISPLATKHEIGFQKTLEKYFVKHGFTVHASQKFKKTKRNTTVEVWNTWKVDMVEKKLMRGEWSLGSSHRALPSEVVAYVEKYRGALTGHSFGI